MFPKKLQQKLQSRIENNSLRKLSASNDLIDFSSNDYLGFATSESIFNATHQYLLDNNYVQNGVSGSRLLSGNHDLYKVVEEQLQSIHQSEALIFNSGYDANIGFFSAVPQRNDVILYDELSHASIRDGIQLSNAKGYSFKHNDLVDLEKRLLSVRAQSRTNDAEVYIVTESVFSMDGDSTDLASLQKLCKKHNVHLIVDEAHAVGVFGFGLVQQLGLEKEVFARIITFGKAMGCHGAAILGSKELKEYLVNFSRSFIYTTGLSPHSLATIHLAYKNLVKEKKNSQELQSNIQYFKAKYSALLLSKLFIGSNSAIQCCVISGNVAIKKCSVLLQENGFDVRPILSPTVPVGQERLRFCLHSYNTHQDIDKVLNLLSTFV
jgi:8-amino-7-oxononanoate synthase